MEIKIKTAEEFHDAHVTIEIRGAQDEVVEFSGQRISGHQADLQEAQLAAARVQRDAAIKRADNLEERLEKALMGQPARVPGGHVCTEKCSPNSHVAFEGRQRLTELEGYLAAAQEAREIETRRADKAEDALIKTRAARERQIGDLEERLKTVQRRNHDYLTRIRELVDERDKLQTKEFDLTGLLAIEKGERAANKAWAERAEAQLGKISSIVLAPALAYPLELAQFSTPEEAAESLTDADERGLVLARALEEVRRAIGAPTKA